jgi:hypothetical protein
MQNEQLEMFSPADVSPETEIDNAVIDAALHHVENQYVLRQLLEGKPWREAFGIGGCSHPVAWMGDAKGIEIYWATENARLIKPARILERARQYEAR